jgi:hypothetical protein
MIKKFKILREVGKITKSDLNPVQPVYVPPLTVTLNRPHGVAVATDPNSGKDYIFVADTIDELANKMGVDRAVFKKTVEEYNKSAKKDTTISLRKIPSISVR